MTDLAAAAVSRPAHSPTSDLLPDLVARPRAAVPGGPTSAGLLPRPAAGYRILRAWQRAVDVAARAHQLARTLPADEAALAGDLRRAGAAVPGHIAAGTLSYDPVEHRRALLAATGALARVETLALLAEHLTLAPAGTVAALLADSADTLRLVRGLARVAGSGGMPAPAARRAVHELPPAEPARARRVRRLPATPPGATPTGQGSA